LAPEARIKEVFKNCATALCAGAVALSLFSLGAEAARRRFYTHHRPEASIAPARQVPYPRLALPFEIPGGQYFPLAWSDVAGWNDDDHLSAYRAFRAS
jgi:membrane-bound lytic murein transglycosylase A